MELWIRSQNKAILRRVKNLYIPESRSKEHWGIYNSNTLFGVYRSKERALKVLDEIQDKIKNMYILENCKLPKESCIEQSLASDDFNIYQMPEE